MNSIDVYIQHIVDTELKFIVDNVSDENVYECVDYLNKESQFFKSKLVKLLYVLALPELKKIKSLKN